MPDEPIDGTAEEVTTADVQPEEVADFLPAIADQYDEHEVFRVLDAHDEQQVLMEAQRRLLKESLYDFPQGGERIVDLSYQGVNEVIRLMNATGRCKIAIDPSSLKVEVESQDAGNGPEPFLIATVYARDEVTGYGQFGTSSEPQRMRLKAHTAKRRRDQGEKIPEDNAVFDVFARAKAVNKAQRNALKVFIPEEIRQTLIATYQGDPNRVRRIQTEAEAKVAELPPPLDDDEARGLIAEAEGIYDVIRDLGAGRGKVDMPPGVFAAWKLQAQHSHDRLRDLIAYLEGRRDEIARKYEVKA